ncbi:MAG: hypothetical protein OEY06_02805 [Gammaproteobacteria bacterium]|nr:hypothetical protein [Gammaproteobacteria bacterium]
MNKTTHLNMLIALLVFNANFVSAEDSMANTSPAIARPVVKISAASAGDLSISIPRAALLVRNGISGVFVLEKNEARFRMVRSGKKDADKVDILSGLFGNETLLVGGLEAVHDGSPVTVLTKKSTGKK